MLDKKLLEDVSKLGVALMLPEEKVNVNKTLADVVKSHDARLWEHYPVMLNSALTKSAVDVHKVFEQLGKAENKQAFKDLALMSEELSRMFRLPLEPYQELVKSLSNVSQGVQKDMKRLRNALVHEAYVPVANVQLSTERLKRAFEDYLSLKKLEEQKKEVKYQEYSLDYALSQLFSPKQKELFHKKLNGGKFSKTEREYFSRTVRKKLVAVANPQLHQLALKLLA